MEVKVKYLTGDKKTHSNPPDNNPPHPCQTSYLYLACSCGCWPRGRVLMYGAETRTLHFLLQREDAIEDAAEGPYSRKIEGKKSRSECIPNLWEVGQRSRIGSNLSSNQTGRERERLCRAGLQIPSGGVWCSRRNDSHSLGVECACRWR